MAWAPDPLWLNISAGVMIGLGLSAASFSIVLAAFGRRVPPEKRSMIFGLGAAAGSMGQFIFAPFGQTLIQTFGWAEALVILSVLMLAIPFLAIPLAGRPGGRAGDSRADVWAGAWRSIRAPELSTAHRRLLRLRLPSRVRHDAPAALHRRQGPRSAHRRMGAGGDRLLQHFWVARFRLDRPELSKPIFLALIYLARAVAIALFVLFPTTPVSVLLFASALGLLWLSTVPPTSALVAIMFGPKYMGMLMGVVFFSHQVGSFLGVWLGAGSTTRQALRRGLVDRRGARNFRRDRALADQGSAGERGGASVDRSGKGKRALDSDQVTASAAQGLSSTTPD